MAVVQDGIPPRVARRSNFRMRNWLTYLCIVYLSSVSGQTPFARVRTALAQHSSIVLLDSCAAKNYCSDSVLYYRGLIHLNKGEVRQASRCVDRLEKDHPGFAARHYLLGILFFSEENYGKCITEFNVVLKTDPANYRALYNRSVAFGMIEEYLSAIEDLDACIKMNPAYTQAYYSRGYWYEFTGNYQRAAADYESTTQLDPSNYDAWIGLAYSYRNLGEPEKACTTLDRAASQGSQTAIELKQIFCK